MSEEIRSPKKQLTAEDLYIKETLPRFEGLTFGGVLIDEELLRQEYKQTEETIRTIENKHLVSLRDELTPLVLRYVASAQESLESGEIASSKFPEPHTSPNLDRIVEELEKDGGQADAIIDAMGSQLYGVENDEEKFYRLASFARHVYRNAVDVTDTNLEQGGSQVERDLDRIFAEKFSDIPATETTKRATFLRSLNLGRSEQILWGSSYPESAQLGKVFGDLQVLRVSEYGEEFSRQLFHVMQAMLSCTPSVKENARAISTKHAEVFELTARGHDDPHLGAWLSLQEGIVSLFQGLSLLTAEKVSGYDDPHALVRDIIAADLPNQLALYAPAGTIGPLTLMGKYIRGILTQENGTLALNAEIKRKMLARKKEAFAPKVKEFLVSRHGELQLPATGRGCPVAFESESIRTTGIKELSRLAEKFIEKAHE